MSAKWVRSKRWDDEHIPGVLWPVKALLRAFSSITLAVCLLLGVVVYAILASVPIGLVALAPTYLIYGLTLVGLVGIVAGLPVWAGSRLLHRQPRGRRFLVLFLLGLALTVAGGWLWGSAVWPALRYDPASGTGLRLFAAFVDANKAITVRRLPILEMSELEFYAWWPLRLILVLFIVNLVVATVRRIEFSLPYLGVLSVHTGIVLIALGSIYYSRDKVEGDILLVAGTPGADGHPQPGPPERKFFDHLRTALHFQIDGMWFQRPIEGLPRYNDYGLGALGGRSARQEVHLAPEQDDGGRVLDLPVVGPVNGAPLMGPGGELKFRVVGYAAYADPEPDWVRVDPATITAILPGQGLNPVRFFDLYSALAEDGQPEPEGIGSPVAHMFVLPDDPRYRISDNYQGAMAIEWTRGMPAERWADLATTLPPGTEHALVVQVPGAEGGVGGVYPVRVGTTIEVGGYRLEVRELTPRPRFPIITAGYRDASSSVAIVHVIPPTGGEYDRWVYHRFPEISQDLLEEKNERGMPKRRDADPAIRIGYVDASQFQVYLDEPRDGAGAVRAIVRRRGGEARVIEGLREGDAVEVVSKLNIRLGERWVHAEPVERPAVVPEKERDKSMVGTHDHAMVAVEVSLAPGDPSAAPVWSRVVWLPFTKFLGAQTEGERKLVLPDGRRLTLAFGRLWRALPGFELSLTDFQMLSYDHRGAPRDYQSQVLVHCTDGSFESFEHVTKLNNPLRAPFMWSESRSWLSNVAGRISSGLSPRQFKFSQAGWDAEGWRQSQALADQGVIPRPRASFTILGVGNNPGIHVIAAGGFLMSVGIPWAFYVKPLIMKSRKKKIQRQLAEGTYRKPERAREAVGVAV